MTRSKIALPSLARLSRVVLEPGDVIVVECPGVLSAHQEWALTASLQRIWPTHAVLVLGDGKRLRIGFVAPDPVPTPPPTKPKRKRTR